MRDGVALLGLVTALPLAAYGAVVTSALVGYRVRLRRALREVQRARRAEQELLDADVDTTIKRILEGTNG